MSSCTQDWITANETTAWAKNAAVVDDPWVRAFLGIGVLYTISSAFTLAKCVRDRQEEDSVTNRVERARVEKLLAEHDPFRVDSP